MSTPSYALTDSTTMLRRNLLHMLRYPSLTLIVLGLPVVLWLIFVYVFGGTLGAGLGTAAGGRSAYASYLAPGILLLTVAGCAQAAAISVASDMTTGIIARFRTMAISRGSVLTGHVLGGVIQGILAVVVVTGIALLTGFRPDGAALAWLAAAGVLAMACFAFTWVCVALGLVSDSVETASNLPNFLLLLPFLGSSFVPAGSMPAGLRWFAEYQPFTPLTETVRGLLTGGPVAGHAIVSAAWCAGLALASWLWARRLYGRSLRQAS